MRGSDLVALAGVVVLAAILVQRLLRLRTVSKLAALIGLLCSATLLWLISQRDDTPTALILGVVAGIGAGLVVSGVGAPPRRPADTMPGTSNTFARVLAALCLVVTSSAVVYIGGSTLEIGWFGGGVTHGPREQRFVALTFDDGPNTTATIAIMRLLDTAGVHGTFFLVGKAVDAEPSIARMLVAHGHVIGNHSYEHDQWRWLDPRYPELERTQRAFKRNGLPCPYWFRPPHGQRTPFVGTALDDAGMGMALWDVSATDWATTDAHRIAQRVLSKARGGSIILLHDGLDGLPNTDRTVVIRALPEILAGLRAKGLTPVGLDQLLGTPATTACP